MQVELYFGEDGISSPDDPYSHRNELQALTSILRLIDISAYSSTQMQKDLFQKLHDAIIDMIHTFAGNNSMQPTIIENHHCDKENDLLKWGEQNGIRARLRIACKYSLLNRDNFLVNKAMEVFFLFSPFHVSRLRFRELSF